MKITPAFIFDLGGVLLDWDRRHLYRKIFSDDPEKMDYFLTHICSLEWNLQMDRGYPFTLAVEELARQYPEWEEPIRAYYHRWEEMLLGPIEPTVTILRSLKESGYPLYALSNWSAETYRRVRSNFEFFDWFDDLLLSGEVGVIKPDPRIFHLFLERIGRSAVECIYIDDTLPNVEVARQLGFQAIHFRSGEQLKDDLERLGIVLEI